jgi:hypothetical protein
LRLRIPVSPDHLKATAKDVWCYLTMMGMIDTFTGVPPDIGRTVQAPPAEVLRTGHDITSSR